MLCPVLVHPVFAARIFLDTALPVLAAPHSLLDPRVCPTCFLSQVVSRSTAATARTNMPAVQTSPWNTHTTAMMGDVCAPLASILRCCVCLLRAPRASDHVCTALRGASCASCSTDTPCCQELGLSRHPRAHLSVDSPRVHPALQFLPTLPTLARACCIAAGPLRNPVIQNAGVLGTAAPRW